MHWASSLLFSAPFSPELSPQSILWLPHRSKGVGHGSPKSQGLWAEITRAGQREHILLLPLPPPHHLPHLHVDVNGLGKATGGSVVSAPSSAPGAVRKGVMLRAETGTVGVGGGDVRVRGCLNVCGGRGEERGECAL